MQMTRHLLELAQYFSIFVLHKFNEQLGLMLMWLYNASTLN